MSPISATANPNRSLYLPSDAVSFTGERRQPFDALGYSVGISDDTIVAGAKGDDEASNLDQGSAYPFDVNALNSRRRAVRR